MRLILHIWRQKTSQSRGKMVRYEHANVNEHMSFLEMLDVLNEELAVRGEDPVAFEHDCREGICGCCGFMINGVAHGPQRGTTVNCTCVTSRMATSCGWSPGGQRHSRC